MDEVSHLESANRVVLTYNFTKSTGALLSSYSEYGNEDYQGSVTLSRERMIWLRDQLNMVLGENNG